SCGAPGALPGGRTGPLTDLQLGARVEVFCGEGYKLVGNNFIWCQLKGNDVEWSKLPTCELITCSPPPPISHGRHDGEGVGIFVYNSTVTYSCDPNFQLVGNGSIHCRSRDKTSGVWSGATPECKGGAQCPFPRVPNGRASPYLGHYRPWHTVSFTCQPGHTLRGSPRSTCGADSRWDPPVPECQKARPCPMPPEVANGHHNGGDKAFFSAGMSVRYSCSPGYYLVGNAAVSCRASGNWSQPRPRCEGKQCSHPGEPVNGKIISLTDLQFGSTVLYSCEEGHRLIGKSSRRCEISGGRVAWSGDIPLCQRIPCEPPPDIPNARHTGRLLSEFHYGTSVTYTCSPGFPLHGDPSIHCTTRDGHSGVWSEPLPACGAGCRAPARLGFAELKEPYRSQTVFPEGSSVEFVCQPGYTQLQGVSPAITCLRNQTWSAALQFCKRQQCPSPGNPENGRAVVLTDLLFGAKINYTCDKGYKLVGGSQRICEVSGTRVSWSGDPPVCQRLTCAAPPAIPHGTHSGGSRATFSLGDVVTYSCASGLAPAGEASLSCSSADGEHGTWSGAVPQCPAIGCTRPEIENGKATGLEATYGLGDIVVFECNFGYALKGSQESQCQFGGKWHPPVPTCEKLPRCPSPPTIRNGQHDSKAVTEFIPGMAVKYHCDPGYVLTGKTSVSCLPTGAWSIPYPRCEAITCSSPTITDGEVAEGRRAVYHPGDNVTFQCHPGFMLRGSRGAECQPDGRWVPAVPTCQPVLQCPSPPNIDKGNHNSQDLEVFPTGVVVNYSCDPGYSLVGEATIHCTDSGNWSLPLPRCAGGCGAPPNLTFAELAREYKNQLEFAAGDTVRYSCRPGHSRRLGVPQTLTCLQNHTWSEALEFCKRKQCKHPDAPRNGRVVVLTDLLFGSSVSHRCDEGYRLVGQSHRRCEILGRDVAWTGLPPTCQRIPCEPPPKIANGDYEERGSYVYQSSVTYRCQAVPKGTDPFSLIGPDTIHCTADAHSNGVWSGPPPECRGLVKCENPRVENGKKTSGFGPSYSYKDSVVFECDRGYFMVGAEVITCEENNTWVPPKPTC
ncbi:CR1 protein, partial [Dicaeum eximium]|nr:CR1 protein [Dicaeum eximium]